MKVKALSPVVSTVLLIFLVSVIAAIVFMWGRGFFGEQLEKMSGGQLKAIELICEEDVNYEAELSEWSTLTISNRGSVPLFSFDIKETEDGESETRSLEVDIPVGDAWSEEISINPSADEIIIFPKVLGSVKGSSKKSNKPFTCLDKGQLLDSERR